MKTIVLTGSPWSDVEALFGELERFGIRNAVNAQNDKNATIRRWYDQLFSSALSNQYQQIQLGKAWEQAVSEVFLANWGNKTWGWADSRSTWLLDFWRDYDPQTRFILVQTNPQVALARAIDQNDGQSSFVLDDVIATWLAYERELLRFYLRNQQRCLLVDFEQASNYPALLMAAANDIFGLEIEPNTIVPDVPAKPIGTPNTALTALLAQQALEKFPEARLLWQEITASLTLLQTAAEPSQEGSAQIEEAITDLRTLSHTVDTTRDALAKAQHERSALVAANQGQVEQLTRANSALATEKTALEQLLSKQSEQNQQENELLLLQLHQVQEELEQYFIKNQSLESDVKSREADLINERNLANGYIQQINELNNSLAQARNEQARQVNEHQQQVNSERDQYAKMAEQSQQESELLLLQLHQVQEELEHYFLQHQQEQQLRKQSEQRLSRVLSRWPDFVDMAGLQVALIAEQNSQEMILTARDVYHASRFIEQYVLRVRLHDNNPAIIIERQDNQLLRWPVDFANETTIVIPIISNQAAPAAVHLATSDWQLLQALSQTCAQMLQLGDFQLIDDSGQFNPAIWQQALIQLAQTFQVYSHRLSYDSVVLKREQVNPDYEHLWLQFSNLHYKNKQWPHAEFRLSAALVNRKGFSIHPKLEFPQPETGMPLFDSWQPDLEDDFGLKMELRVEVKSQAVDINFWNSLSSVDQALLLNLIFHLPQILADLEAQKIAIGRPWQDWQNLVVSTIETIHARRVELGLEQPAQPSMLP